ncbi:MAG: 2-oxoglutarate dehydrogenase E1 component [Thermomicrobiales bacterium]|nr:2-oxoglutarate dehydrogenase E1 component [Thermomicrobiales bacterium]MCO5220848.1 2-oxoglutarate dehydrogenase E1 component [Thermomicrobiales bacterium]
MSDLGAFYGPNAGYVLELYEQYQQDPTSVGPRWQTYFEEFTPELPRVTNGHVGTPATATPAVDLEKVVGAAALAQAIREYGHLDASIDPLGRPVADNPDLDLDTYRLTDADLRALPAMVVGGEVAASSANAYEAIQKLRAIYTGSTGYDFDHVHLPAERAWLTEAAESQRFAQPMERSARRALLRRLTDVEAFERFLHQTYLGQKRFSIEGTDMLVPMLDEIVLAAASDGVREVIFGMAHRGRLNVMTHVLGKPYQAIIAAFEGAKWHPKQDENDPAQQFSGDVKYHLGARLLRGEQGHMVEVPLALAPNPSHLEAVNPVVEGMVRALQDVTDKPGKPVRDNKAGMAILIHGDAAFPGQGVVAETLNLSALPGYTTGGTIHIIANNQVGFTTSPSDSRSTRYAGDLAKGFEIPVVHVNADDPESCLAAVRMAIEYRDTFGKDFLVDLVGYRKWGHNEGDEPSFTQPEMYRLIDKHPTVRDLFAQQLLSAGDIQTGEAETMLQGALDNLAGIRRSVTDGTANLSEDVPPPPPRRGVDTGVPEETLREYHRDIHAVPEGFTITSKLARQWDRRAKVLDSSDARIDWAHAETLAFAAILAEGTPIRLTGQDSERGTFSQRHLVLHSLDGSTYTPLTALPAATASFAVYNSALSEEATVGFEYGYSVQAPGRLVIWEGQFGDFANGAQVMIDQFISAARTKWRVEPSLVLLLPHGYEGQGPEHSSARLERFLQLYAQDNIRVVNATTSAQYFHLLRRQAALLLSDPRPLVVMTPKSLLRNPAAASELKDLVQGTFQMVMDDAINTETKSVTRLVLCSGKVAVDLDASPLRAETQNVAIARVEQLAPFPKRALGKTLALYPNLKEVVWLQEEPQNMGAWTYIHAKLREIASGLPVSYIGRPERASPAEGAADLHAVEQKRIVAAAFEGAPSPRASRSNGNGRKNTANGHAESGESVEIVEKKTAKSRS